MLVRVRDGHPTAGEIPPALPGAVQEGREAPAEHFSSRM